MSVEGNSSDLDLVGLVQPSSTRAARLASVCTTIVLLEFFCVAVAAYLANAAYEYAVYSHFEKAAGVTAALYLAVLVSIIALAFRQFVGVQRQPMHALLWSGIGAVALAFSFFLSTLFLLKATEEYSRGTFFIQVVAVGCVVCALRGGFYVWLQGAVRAGQVEARRVVLIGDERNRSQFTELVKSTGFNSIASLPFPHYRTAQPGHECAALVDSKAARRMIDYCRSVHPDDVVILSSQDELPASPELARL
ncbi:MAG: hypothetical protein WA652_10950, partial [Xanthobacteraceae bacterium]